MFSDTLTLTARSLKKWVRNPAAILPGLITSVFWLALFGSSFNPSNLIPSGIGSSSFLSQIQAQIMGQTFGGAPTYITFLTAGIICLILIFNMGFGGIDLVLDRQLGFLNTLLTAPISRASIYLAGVLQNFVKAMVIGVLTFVVALVIPNGLQLAQSFGVLDLFGVFTAISLLAFGFSLLFTAIALVTKVIDSLVAIVNFLILPIVFMSNAMFPTSSFPAWLKTVAEVNPVSKAVEASRLLIINGTLSSAQLWTFTSDLIYLVVFVLVLGVFGFALARRALRAA
jgi:ABC-2 type transport system permease protein